jgi:hypothetical protein
VSPTAIRYPARAAARARVLREGGWSSEAIAGFIEREFGARPTRGTVLRWCDPDFAERVDRWRRATNMRANAERWTFRVGGQRPSDEYRTAFVRRLAGEGVSAQAIGKVCGVVFGEPLTRDQVYGLLRRES